MRSVLVAAILLWASLAQAIVTWTVTKPGDCTGVNLPSGCCVAAAPAANPGCVVKQVGGSVFSTRVDLRSDGGTYSTGGDTLSNAATGYIGINTIQFANCWSSNGMDVVPLMDLTGKVIKMKLFSTANTEMTTAAIATTVWLTCDFYGH